MRNLVNRSGFTVIETILAVLLLVAIGAAGYWAFVDHSSRNQPPASSTTPSSTSTPAVSAAQAVALVRVQAFYKAWLSDSLPKIASYQAQGYVTAQAAGQEDGHPGFDYVTCSQNPLKYDEYRFSTPVITGSTGTMTISGNYSGPPESTLDIKLDLLKQPAGWAVNIITCPTT